MRERQGKKGTTRRRMRSISGNFADENYRNSVEILLIFFSTGLLELIAVVL